MAAAVADPAAAAAVAAVTAVTAPSAVAAAMATRMAAAGDAAAARRRDWPWQVPPTAARPQVHPAKPVPAAHGEASSGASGVLNRKVLRLIS